MRALVTGGAGFIGSHIVHELLGRGCEVRVVDDLSTGKRENLDDVNTDIEFIEGDIRNSNLMNRAMKGVTWVFHQAALPSVPRSVVDPLTSTDVNVMGTTVVLKAAVDADVQRVVFAASSSAYGNTTQQKKAESSLPGPLSPYAVTKLAGEYMMQAFAKCYPIETIGLRYFNVFGERQDPYSQYSGVIAKFCRQMLSGERPTINGDGTVSRDFTYVRNVVNANMLAATAPAEVSGNVMNIACGGRISLIELVTTLNKLLGTDLHPKFGAPRLGDIQHSCADISRAQALLGYEPTVNFESGLSRTLQWYRESLSAKV